jgi:hypothetical protein
LKLRAIKQRQQDVTDNGCGMDKDTLCNVFLSMGGTKKNDGSVGGFGYAKNIILFAHASYSIRTGSNLVEGIGGAYNITQVEPIRGTIIEVVLENINPDYLSGVCVSYINQMFVQMTLNRDLVIRVNGHEVEQDSIEYDLETKTKLGKLWFSEVHNSKEETSVITIAVQGLPMFKHFQVFNGFICTGIMNLDGDTLELLTANRDSLRNPEVLRAELRNTFVDRMIRNGLHAVKWFYNLTLPFTATSYASSVDSPKVVDATTISEALTSGDYPDNFCVRVHNFSLSSRRSDKSLTATQIRDILKKKHVQKLAHIWNTCVYSVLSIASSTPTNCNMQVEAVKRDGCIMTDSDWDTSQPIEFYYRNLRIHVGFIFEPGIEGMCSSNASGYEILINPEIFKSRTDSAIEDMLDVAFHECAHLAQANHCMDFCIVSDELRRAWRRVYKPNCLKSNWLDILFYE